MSELEKTNPEDALTMLMSFHDPNVMTSVMAQMGYTLTFEIEETVRMAQQNENLSIKMKALKHLRELLKEAAEMSGMVANVSHTVQGECGETTTFHAKKMAGILSSAPKKVESKIIEGEENEQRKEIKTDDGRGPGKSSEPTSPKEDGQYSSGFPRRGDPTESLQAGRAEDIGCTSAESANELCPSNEDAGRGIDTNDFFERANPDTNGDNSGDSDQGDNPCIDRKPPAGVDPELFRGVTGTSAGNQ